MSRRLIATFALVACVFGPSCGSEDEGDTLTRALNAHAGGRIDEAVELYRDVLADDPGNKFAHYNLGLIEQRRGRPDAAETEYVRALGTDERFVPALFNLAILRSETDPAGAIDLYRRVIDAQPNNAAAHLNLGFLLEKTGDQDTARAEFDKAVQLDPSLAERIETSPSPSPAGPSGPS